MERAPRIVLAVDEDIARRLGPEGHRIAVDGEADDEAVRIDGGSAAGVFRGAQTLRQLLGPDAFRRAPVHPDREWTLPRVVIEDAPRFAWRGFLLDVARHFMPKDGVLRYLDLLAAHKLNVLHLHLTDDQGWRLQIRRYPKLAGTGAWRARTKLGHRASPLWDERPHGGFYTQDDMREIVAYAAERHITVVPEIDIPGHSQAAIAAYPELGNTDAIDTASLSVLDTWGITENVLAPTDNTLAFYENVLAEVLELFPSRFVHLGGDECPATQWRASPAARARAAAEGLADVDALRGWFVRHFGRWLAERGRTLVELGRNPRRWRPCGPEGRRRLLVARPRGRHRRGTRGPPRRHVPRAAGVSGPPSGRGRTGARTHRIRPYSGGCLPFRPRAPRS
ncbi:hypothetical protein GCM10020000_50240 [Streptomyces olivoverticillatus]